MGILDSIVGGLSKNPSFVALAGLGIVAFIFRDKISSFFSDITGGVETAQEVGQTVGILNDNLQGNLTGLQDILSGKILEDVQLPKIELPTFNFDFGSILSGLFPQEPTAIPTVQESSPLLEQVFRPLDFNTERTDVSFGTEIIVPQGDELNLGGGLSFIGGTTTFGDNLVDTLTEVLRAFPQLSASQARNLLDDNQGLTQSQFLLVNPLGSSSLSSAGVDPDQILNNAGDFSGLTSEQIAQLLTGGNINNF